MVSGFGGDPHIIARVMLKHFGLDPDRNVKFVPGPHQMAALPRCTKAWFLQRLWDLRSIWKQKSSV